MFGVEFLICEIRISQGILWDRIELLNVFGEFSWITVKLVLINVSEYWAIKKLQGDREITSFDSQD